MKKYVYNTVPRPRSLDHLKEKILESRSYETLSAEHVKKAFLQLPRRARTCISKNGYRFDEAHLLP